jgi:hypothetical protein
MPRQATAGGRLIDALRGSPRTGLVGEAEVSAYLAAHPKTAAWSVVCGPASNVLVVGLDQHPGGTDGLATMRELECQRRPLPAPPMVLNPTGAGRHLYFAWPGELVRSGPIAPGVEILGDRMAATLPPSRKLAGAYRWGLARHPSCLPLPELPQWLLAMIRPPAPPPRARHRRPQTAERRETYALAALWREAEAVSRAPSGAVDVTLCRAAWNVARFVSDGNLDSREIEDRLVDAAIAAGHPQRRAERTVGAAVMRRAAA